MTCQPNPYPEYAQEHSEDDLQIDPAGYRVGRGKPPKHTQFKPGQSGNPGGKRKNEESCHDLLKEEMDRLIAIRENGKTITLSKRKAFVKAVVNGAIQGNPSDEKILLRFIKWDEKPRKNGSLQIIKVDSEDEIPDC